MSTASNIDEWLDTAYTAQQFIHDAEDGLETGIAVLCCKDIRFEKPKLLHVYRDKISRLTARCSALSETACDALQSTHWFHTQRKYCR